MIIQRRLPFEPSSLDELQNLAESAGYQVVGSLEQVRKPDSRYQIGSGKVRELAELVAENNAERIIFENRLKPVQAYNLAKATGVEAIDRFQLILEIFVRRASTLEAKLQIRLAKLQYELTHAKERVRLARMEEQPGFMGLGAYEVDVYYETVKRQIRYIREKLLKKRKKRRLHRFHRAELGFPSISLAGYTNAGKSFLFNTLGKETAAVDSELFTTLSTTTRAVKLSGKKALLTDTVGFIDRLPIELIEAFHPTLEETVFSDLILLVVDVSDPEEEIRRKLSCSLETIQKIGANGIPIVTAFNKIDLLSDVEAKHKVETLKEMASNPVLISALYKTNMELLKQQLANQLFKSYVRASFSVPVTDESMSFFSWLKNRADVQEIKYEGEKMKVVFESVPWFVNEIKGQVVKLGGTLRRKF
ncbi:MAG: GTPase HflX [Thermoproteota archaeon]|nr:GTPase HflX [Thermoproteota archaeon]